MTESNRQHISHRELQFIKSLQRKNVRTDEGLLVAEGDKLVGELLKTDWPLVRLIVTADSGHANHPAAVLVGEKEMERMSGLSSPSPSLAVAHQPKWAALTEEITGFTPVLDDIRDPGNLGTIIRTADWFGFDKIICSRTTADVWNPKTIQASMGSVFRMPVHYVDLETYFQTHSGTPVYVLDMNGRPLDRCADLRPGFLVLGNEANGPGAVSKQWATGSIAIPGRGGAESLNVASAAAIALYYFSFLKP